MPTFVAQLQSKSTLGRLLPAKYVDQYTSVSLSDASKIKLSQIEANLKQMPWVENIFIGMPLLDSEIELLKMQFPQVIFSRTRNYPHIQFLRELDDLDNDELYYYNNPKLAADKGIQITDASTKSIGFKIEFIQRLGHPIHWNNEQRRYEFASHDGSE